MDRILLLNNTQFPKSFDSIDAIPPAGETKVAFTENRILMAINKYYKNLNVTSIEYLAIESQFPYFKVGISNGAIVEEFDIDPSRANVYQRNGCFVYTTDGVYKCRRLMLYIFVSSAKEKTRTAFVSQTVFPTLIDYAKDHLASPSYSISNHKFCFLNVLNKTISANMILRHLASLCAAGMDYVEVFDKVSIIPSQIPNDLKEFLQIYSSDYDGNYIAATNAYEDDNYRIDFNKKVFKWKTASIIDKVVPNKTATTVDFQGSSEKFYWIETLPMALFAYNQGYKVDYSDYTVFIDTYRTQFSKNSEKFARCEVLLQYAQKYFDA